MLNLYHYVALFSQIAGQSALTGNPVFYCLLHTCMYILRAYKHNCLQSHNVQNGDSSPQAKRGPHSLCPGPRRRVQSLYTSIEVQKHTCAFGLFRYQRREDKHGDLIPSPRPTRQSLTPLPATLLSRPPQRHHSKENKSTHRKL